MAFVVLTVTAAVVLFVALGGIGGGSSHELKVSVGATNVGGGGLGCEPGNKLDREFAGTRISVADADGTTLGAGSTPSGGQYSESDGDGCLWSVTIADVGDSDAYTLTVQRPNGQEQQLNYSKSELQSENWELVLTVGL